MAFPTPGMPRRRGRWLAALALLAVAAVVVVIVVSNNSSNNTGTGAGTTATGAASVQRRNLVATDTESGTLSYAEQQTVYNRLNGTITWVPQIGAVVAPGHTLFKVDNKPVMLMNGSTPAFRDLTSTDATGPDVYELNRNLADLGYNPDGIVVDDEWQSATTAGIDELQHALGDTETGELTLGQVVFLPGPQMVQTVDTTVGSTAASYTPSAGWNTEFVDFSRDTTDTSTDTTTDTTTGTTTTPVTTTGTTTASATTPPATTTTTHTSSTPTTTQRSSQTPSSSNSGSDNLSQRTLQALMRLIRQQQQQLRRLEQASHSPSSSSNQPSSNNNASHNSDKSSNSNAGTSGNTGNTGSTGHNDKTGDTGSTGNTGNSGGGAGGGGSAAAVMSTSSTKLVVTVDLGASVQSEATIGEHVTVEMPDGSTVGGTVTAVSPVAQSSSSGNQGSTGGSGAGGSGSSTVPVTITLDKAAKGGGLDQASVSVNFIQNKARHVLSVPVTALLATSGSSFAVQEAAAPHRLIPIQTGLFAAGYVEISGSGIHPGLKVTDSQG